MENESHLFSAINEQRFEVPWFCLSEGELPSWRLKSVKKALKDSTPTASVGSAIGSGSCSSPAHARAIRQRAGHCMVVSPIMARKRVAKIERYDESPIKTSYDLLWDELRRGEKNPLIIQNTMQRILEHYFKILGGVGYDDLCDKFEGREKLVCRSLLSSVNDGSHYSHDDAHFAFGQDAIDD